ncbi:hypothetical protein COW46_01225 [Candidatus Gracilibacteria bacterium CG17_big_fil_post_rev_8_21_14_2_50_48_13]|nr:MAG: hypothetical protein COW46_01225 [Candidatus Gracilibacteria bacterium CG17_big_fil_post_rev_8_21_14_2_50_48_13]
MAVRTVCHMFGVRMQTKTLANLAFLEIAVLGVAYFALIIFRYATPYLSHELFLELLVILGVGMSFDHYAVTSTSLTKEVEKTS